MAGIFGIAGSGASAREVLGRMGALMRHGESERVDSRVLKPGSGHGAGSGLSAGLSAGLGVVHLGTVHPEPPLAYDAKSGTLAVLDGEIFADEAGGAPCPAGTTEAEYMLSLFLRGGPAALADRDGHWSFAVIEADGTTTLIADHFGSRQLMYRTLGDGGIAFFSELKGALALPGETLRFDHHGIAQLFLLQAPLGETTTIEGVTLVRGGGFVKRAPDGALTIGEYRTGSPPAIYDSTSPAEWIDEYVARLKRSVAVRTLKPPRTGVTLSSGHDSRLMVGAYPENARPLHTFTFGDPRSYDRRNARKIARVMRSTHHETNLTREEYLGVVNDYLWFNDAMVPCRHGQISCLFPMLRSHVGAVLEGVPAASEIFYMQHYQSFSLFAPIDEDAYVREHFRARCKMDQADAVRLLAGPYSEAAAMYPDDRYHDAIGRGFPAFPAIRAIHISTWQRLRRFSNMGARFMRTAVEVRQPLLEHALYECSLRMPPELYVDHRNAYAEVLKRLEPKLARIMIDKTRLPPDPTIADLLWCWRKNSARNFLTRFAGGRFRPYDSMRTFDATNWLSGAFRENMREVLLSDSLADRGIFNMDEIRALVKRLDEGRPKSKDILWTIYGLELWCRRALDRGGEA